jgi:hypothetical protein
MKNQLENGINQKSFQYFNKKLPKEYQENKDYINEFEKL